MRIHVHWLLNDIRHDVFFVGFMAASHVKAGYIPSSIAFCTLVGMIQFDTEIRFLVQGRDREYRFLRRQLRLRTRWSSESEILSLWLILSFCFSLFFFFLFLVLLYSDSIILTIASFSIFVMTILCLYRGYYIYINALHINFVDDIYRAVYYNMTIA